MPTMKPSTIVSALFAILITAMILVAPMCFGGCAEQPEVPTTIDAEDAVHVAREHLDAVAKALQEAEKTVIAATKMHDALVDFRASYKAERYSEAVGHLRKAVAEAETAGYEVPPDVVERLGQAQLLLELAGK